MYVLNHKRSTLTEMEARFGVTITIEVDETVGSQHYAIFRGAIAEKPLTPVAAPASPITEPEDDEDPEIVEEEEEVEETATPEQSPASSRSSQRDGDQRRRPQTPQAAPPRRVDATATARTVSSRKAPCRWHDVSAEAGQSRPRRRRMPRGSCRRGYRCRGGCGRGRGDRKKRRRGKRGGRRQQGGRGERKPMRMPPAKTQ